MSFFSGNIFYGIHMILGYMKIATAEDPGGGADTPTLGDPLFSKFFIFIRILNLQENC